MSVTVIVIVAMLRVLVGVMAVVIVVTAASVLMAVIVIVTFSVLTDGGSPLNKRAPIFKENYRLVTKTLMVQNGPYGKTEALIEAREKKRQADPIGRLRGLSV